MGPEEEVIASILPLSWVQSHGAEYSFCRRSRLFVHQHMVGYLNACQVVDLCQYS